MTRFERMSKPDGPSFEVFGFCIPLTDDGRRLWTLEFKRYIAAKLNAREMSATKVGEICNVSSSQVYQWKMEVIGKGVNSRPWRKSHRMFKEVTMIEDRVELASDQPDRPSTLTRIQGRYTALCLPADYPVDALIAVLKVLEGDR